MLGEDWSEQERVSLEWEFVLAAGHLAMAS